MARNPTSTTFAVTFPQRRHLVCVEVRGVEPVDVELLAAAHFSATQILAGSAFASQAPVEDGLGAARRAPGLLSVALGGSAATRGMGGGAGGGGGRHEGGGPVGPFGGSALRCSIAPPDLGD
ncbi:MAG: hypothetical protein M3306_06580 [Actinomycetota bacterium]|nr:hypothetical protein [Actinomycetota bacterium]